MALVSHKTIKWHCVLDGCSRKQTQNGFLYLEYPARIFYKTEGGGQQRVWPVYKDPHPNSVPNYQAMSTIDLLEAILLLDEIIGHHQNQTYDWQGQLCKNYES